jgi:hypothetical protein
VYGLARPVTTLFERGWPGIALPPVSPESKAEMSKILEHYLARREAACELNKCPATLDRWRKRGEGPPYIKVGRDIYYSRTAILSWIERPVAR